MGEFVAGFPIPSYFPQYQLFHHRHRRRSSQWFHNVPKSMGRAAFALVLVATVTLLPLALAGGASFVAGYGSWESAVWALWDSTVAVGMSLGLITLFCERINWSGRFTRFLQRHSYTVYVILAPIIVFVAVALMWLSLEHMFRFGMAAVITVALFRGSILVLKILFVSRIL